MTPPGPHAASPRSGSSRLDLARGRGPLEGGTLPRARKSTVSPGKGIDEAATRLSGAGEKEASLAGLAAGTLAAGVAFVVRVLTGPHTVDDAYITFRYARNLAEGVGLVYNPGEWVLGTTTPLWAAVLAGVYRLGLTNLELVASVLSALCDAGTAALLTQLARAAGLRWWGAVLVGLAWAINPVSVAYGTGGMETSLFVLTVLGSLTLTARGRPMAGAALASAGVLVRPEAALAALVALGWAWLRSRRLFLPTLLTASVPVGLAALAFLVWYGSPLPHSIVAKQVAYRVDGPWATVAALVLQIGLPGWSTFVLGAWPVALVFPLAVLVATTLGFLAWKALPALQRGSLPWQPFAAFALAYVLFFVAGGLRGARLWPWYLVPIIPFYLLAASVGLAQLGRGAPVWAGLVLLLWQLPAVDWQRPFLPLGASLERERLYLQIGQELAREIPVGTVVAAPEIGALGYASRLPILDTVGLVSPAAVRYYPLPSEQLVADNAIPAQLIADLEPGVVVTLDEFARLSLLPDERFQERYQLYRAYPVAIWSSQALLVYRRIAAPGSQ